MTTVQYDQETGEYLGDDAALVGTNLRGVLIKKYSEEAKWEPASHTSIVRGEVALDPYLGKKTKILNMEVMVLASHSKSKWQAWTEADGWGENDYSTEEEATVDGVGRILDWANEKGFLK